jgi:hypothetical protein
LDGGLGRIALRAALASTGDEGNEGAPVFSARHARNIHHHHYAQQQD